MSQSAGSAPSGSCEQPDTPSAPRWHGRPLHAAGEGTHRRRGTHTLGAHPMVSCVPPHTPRNQQHAGEPSQLFIRALYQRLAPSQSLTGTRVVAQARWGRPNAHLSTAAPSQASSSRPLRKEGRQLSPECPTRVLLVLPRTLEAALRNASLKRPTEQHAESLCTIKTVN